MSVHEFQSRPTAYPEGLQYLCGHCGVHRDQHDLTPEERLALVQVKARQNLVRAQEANMDRTNTIWSKKIELAAVDNEQSSATIGIQEHPSSGRKTGWMILETDEVIDGQHSHYESGPVPITTKNMAGDLAHALDELKDHLSD